MTVPLSGMAVIDNDQFNGLCRRVMHFINEHIESEEAFMLRVSYPGYMTHHLEHVSLRNLMNVYFRPDDMTFGNKTTLIRECLREFRHHILYHDIPFVNYIKENDLVNQEIVNG